MPTQFSLFWSSVPGDPNLLVLFILSSLQFPALAGISHVAIQFPVYAYTKDRYADTGNFSLIWHDIWFCGLDFCQDSSRHESSNL